MANVLNYESTEEKLSDIFSSAMNLNSDFSKGSSFLELGGTSIEAMKIQIEIRKAFGVKMKMDTLYELGSVERIAERICNE